MRHRLPKVLLALFTASCANNGSQDPVAEDEQAPATVDHGRQAERLRMVETQIERRGVRDPLVLAAMRAVPRHGFVPSDVRSAAYRDGALPIGWEQTISQPLIVAMMTEAIAIGPDSKVLEIGTGSGYQAAVLAEITPHVFTIEILPELAARAKATLEEHGYDTVRCRTGDGYAGWPDEAPFDAVIVTAAPGFIPPRLFEQLAVGGRLCIPVGDSRWGQELLLVTKAEDGSMQRRNLGAVSFVPMTGAVQEER